MLNNKNLLRIKYPVYTSFLCDDVVITASKFKNDCVEVTFHISENQSKYDTDSLMFLRDKESQLVKDLINKAKLKQKNFNIKTFIKSNVIDTNEFVATRDGEDIIFNKNLDLPKEIKLKYLLNIKEHLCMIKDSDKKISIEDVRKLTKLDKVRITISSNLYSFRPMIQNDPIIYLRGKITAITIQQQNTKNISKKIVPKQTDTRKMFVPKYSSKTSTITQNVLEMLKNDY